jgi:hypothetical protein
MITFVDTNVLLDVFLPDAVPETRPAEDDLHNAVDNLR